MKSDSDLKKTNQEDWHKATIVAELHKRDISLAQLSLSLGLSRGTIQNALHRPYPTAELVIAEALGRKPQEIWPSRYDAEGKSLLGSKSGRVKMKGHLAIKLSGVNPQPARAA